MVETPSETRFLNAKNGFRKATSKKIRLRRFWSMSNQKLILLNDTGILKILQFDQYIFGPVYIRISENFKHFPV